MQQVIGVGGIFFKAKDPERMYQWTEARFAWRRRSDPMAEAGTEGTNCLRHLPQRY